MWLLLRRRARPDALYWPGRRFLASLDAVAWPCAWILIAFGVRGQTALVGSVVIAFAVLIAVRRLRRAIWNNGRYFFSTWRWGRVLSLLLFVGWLVKLVFVARR